MKKVFILLAFIVLIILSLIYIIIPGKISISETIPVKAPLLSVSRSLSQMGSWKKWWPGDQPLIMSKRIFTPLENIYNVIDIIIRYGQDSTMSRMDLVFIDRDSMFISWRIEIKTGISPLKRYSVYRRTKNLQKDIKEILKAMKTFMQDENNIYGINVRNTFVTDSVLISTRRSFSYQPGVTEIYQMVKQLKKYISDQNAVEKNYPMLNVQKVNEEFFEAMVAIPVDRRLPETGIFSPKMFLKGGNILESEILGGPHTIETSFREFEHYRLDYNYTSPAIPYQLLVTDRSLETDTTKWITRFYYPVL